MNGKNVKNHLDHQIQPVSKYEPPTMITYSEEELFEEMETMSVQACSSFNSAVGCP